jgi:hypothetical protein
MLGKTWGSVCLTIIATLGLAGCAVPGAVTGGGSLVDSTSGAKLGTFTVNAKQCDLSKPATGVVMYSDAGGIGLKGNITNAYGCYDSFLALVSCAEQHECELNEDGIDCLVQYCVNVQESCGACMLGALESGLPIVPNYGSLFATNFTYTLSRKGGGTGTGIACLRDNGRGKDWALLELDGAVSLTRQGLVQGNVQAQQCN